MEYVGNRYVAGIAKASPLKKIFCGKLDKNKPEFETMGRTVQRLNELYATNGQIGFVATERVDGKVILPEGIQLLQMK